MAEKYFCYLCGKPSSMQCHIECWDRAYLKYSKNLNRIAGEILDPYRRLTAMEASHGLKKCPKCGRVSIGYCLECGPPEQTADGFADALQRAIEEES